MRVIIYLTSVSDSWKLHLSECITDSQSVSASASDTRWHVNEWHANVSGPESAHLAGNDQIGAEAAMAPSTIFGYFIRSHADSIPP